MADRASHLSDDEARALFRAVLRPTAGSPQGNRFRASLDEALVTTGLPDLSGTMRVTLPFSVRNLLRPQVDEDTAEFVSRTWWRPSVGARLDVDAEIDALVRRHRSPRIEPEPPGAAPDFGPYISARLKLAECCELPTDIARKIEAVAEVRLHLQTVQQAKEAVSAVLSMTNRGPTTVAGQEAAMSALLGAAIRQRAEDPASADPKAQTWRPPFLYSLPHRNLALVREDLSTALQALDNLGVMIAKRYEAVQEFADLHGNVAVWPYLFVAHLGEFWRRWTGEKPSRSIHSLFGGFVQAAWNSLGDDMPEVSFERALQNLPRP